MDMPFAETFANIAPVMPTLSQSDDVQTLFRMDTKDLYPSPSTVASAEDDINMEKLLNDLQCALDSEPTKPLAYAAFVADHFNKVPELDDIKNLCYNFDVDMRGLDCGSSSWCYSKQLKKMYVKKKNSFTVHVSHRNALPESSGLYLRVMLVCSAPQEVHRPIQRCQHDIAKDGAQGDATKDHIVRCVNPTATYSGLANGVEFKDRLAMRIELHGYGEQVTTPVSLEFLCQNSCPTIERRATALVFTLETEHGAILGRKSICVKICSCPRRDMSKEEGKSTSTTSVKRKRKLEGNDSTATVDQQPPARKLTRQSSLSDVRPTRSSVTANHQHDSPVPSTSSVLSLDCIKKETVPYAAPIARSSSTISNASVENDSSAITVNIRLPDIATAVEMVEYAFKHISADMMRSKITEEKRHRLAKYLAHCRRVKSDLKKGTEEETTQQDLVYDSD